MTSLPPGYERRYGSPRSSVAHAVFVHSPPYPARCGSYAPHLAGWYGTGSQSEMERAASLPLCKSCERTLPRD